MEAKADADGKTDEADLGAAGKAKDVMDMDDMPTCSVNCQKSKQRFVIKKWNAVALWAWDIVVDNCAIAKPDHGLVHRMPGQPNPQLVRGLHRSLGDVQPRFPFSLHLPLAQNAPRVPFGQPGVGVPEVRPLV